MCQKINLKLKHKIARSARSVRSDKIVWLRENTIASLWTIRGRAFTVWWYYTSRNQGFHFYWGTELLTHFYSNMVCFILNNIANATWKIFAAYLWTRNVWICRGIEDIKFGFIQKRFLADGHHKVVHIKFGVDLLTDLQDSLKTSALFISLERERLQYN